jgi:hypothetical protein
MKGKNERELKLGKGLELSGEESFLKGLIFNVPFRSGSNIGYMKCLQLGALDWSCKLAFKLYDCKSYTKARGTIIDPAAQTNTRRRVSPFTPSKKKMTTRCQLTVVQRRGVNS